jgi:hypothetical protein
VDTAKSPCRGSRSPDGGPNASLAIVPQRAIVVAKIVEANGLRA